MQITSVLIGNQHSGFLAFFSSHLSSLLTSKTNVTAATHNSPSGRHCLSSLPDCKVTDIPLSSAKCWPGQCPCREHQALLSPAPSLRGSPSAGPWPAGAGREAGVPGGRAGLQVAGDIQKSCPQPACWCHLSLRKCRTLAGQLHDFCTGADSCVGPGLEGLGVPNSVTLHPRRVDGPGTVQDTPP